MRDATPHIRDQGARPLPNYGDWSVSRNSYTAHVILSLAVCFGAWLVAIDLAARKEGERLSGYNVSYVGSDITLRSLRDIGLAPDLSDGRSMNAGSGSTPAARSTSRSDDRRGGAGSVGNDGSSGLTGGRGDSVQQRRSIPGLQRASLGVSDIRPTIVGGMRAFYVHIEYPEVARRAGIQGRMRVSFYVEADGTPSEIRVDLPLHPSCDSAAVRALRATRFVPLRQDGEIARVRMSLPILFYLTEPPGTDGSG